MVRKDFKGNLLTPFRDQPENALLRMRFADPFRIPQPKKISGIVKGRSP